jgi:hypothetical protein
MAPKKTTDRRAEFERLSRQTPRDPDAERAFFENKIDLIRSDPTLSDDEKTLAIAEVRRRQKRES